MTAKVPLSPSELQKLRSLHSAGLLNTEIALELGRSDGTISKWMVRLRLAPNTIAQRKIKRIAELKARQRSFNAERPPNVASDLLLNRLMAGAR